jgi:glycosyltransferase involved in cell wall biosynthesis
MKVSLFRAFPDIYRQSMTIYADCLLRGLNASEKVSAEDYLPHPVFLQPPLRYFSQYLHYPAAAVLKQGDVNHIVDHAYAHLTHTLDTRKTVVTFHDAIWLKYRGQNSGSFSLAQRLNLSGLGKAAVVVCDSEASKKSLFEFLPNYMGKAEVVAPGVDPLFFSLAQPALRKNLGLGDENLYLLHVGHNAAYKNIEGLLEILARVLSKAPQAHLIKVGPPLTQTQQDLAENLKVAHRIIHKGSLSKSQLLQMYQAADFLVQPSLDEGFGFPALEAMGSGLSVVASDRGSLPEIIGDAGIFKKPNDHDGFAEIILKLASDPALRRDLKEKGRRRAALFTWEETVRKLIKIYKEVAGS